MAQIKQGTKIEEIPRVKTPEVKLPAFESRKLTLPTTDIQPKYGTLAVDIGGGKSIVVPRIMAEQMAGKGQGIPQTKEVMAQKQEQQKNLELVQQLGSVGPITPERRAELEAEVSPGAQFAEGLPGALREGTTQAVTRGLTLGAAGAAAGALGGPAAPVTVPVAAAIGAAAGVISGYWTAIRGATKSEAKEDVSNAMAEFTQLKKGMTNVATLATSSQINPEEAVELYNAQYSRMLELQAQLKYLTDSDLKDYLSDGSGNLITVSTFLDEVAPVYKTRLQTAFLNPSETTIPYSDEFEGEE